MLQEVNRRESRSMRCGRPTWNFNLTRLNKVDYSFTDKVQETLKEGDRTERCEVSMRFRFENTNAKI